MQLLRLQVAVNLRNGNTGMPKELLDFVKGYPILYQPACERVSKATFVVT
jgi:hypothetical protein